MLRFKKDNIQYGQFHLLNKFQNINHATFFRGHNDLSFHQENMKASLNLVSNALGFEHFVLPHLIHSNGISITQSNFQNITLAGQCDGLISVQKGSTLVISHADCQAAIFFDPYENVIANVHSGWRGNVQNIYKSCVEKMVKTFSCNPANIIVCIAPSLGPKHSQFINYKQEFPQSFLPFKENTNYFNLWRVGEYQLLQSGILKKNIEFANVCSFECQHDCFSYRRNKTKLRNATLISLLE
ncbi:MAG: polyphenol oxidase family protein [Rhabdochlamydiaceae bacterium]|nr:polyphenol oxidase family protein [Candidatus Amphrikana amoebophyrae]